VPLGVCDLLEHNINTSFLFLNVAVALVARVVVALELKVLPANLASEWKYKLKSAGFRSGWGDA
jgi:hypothetical protein